MSGGIRTHCPECNKKIESPRSCKYCGWNYEKEFSGQKELFVKDEESAP